MAERVAARVSSPSYQAYQTNLLTIPGYLDVALRDFGLALGAFALARLSEEYAS
jgi:hypothetical protein